MMTTTEDKQVTKASPRSLSSLALLGDKRELLISHNGETYRLRITANGKLILTK